MSTVPKYDLCQRFLFECFFLFIIQFQGEFLGLHLMNWESLQLTNIPVLGSVRNPPVSGMTVPSQLCAVHSRVISFSEGAALWGVKWSDSIFCQNNFPKRNILKLTTRLHHSRGRYRYLMWPVLSAAVIYTAWERSPGGACWVNDLIASMGHTWKRASPALITVPAHLW